MAKKSESTKDQLFNGVMEEMAKKIAVQLLWEQEEKAIKI